MNETARQLTERRTEESPAGSRTLPVAAWDAVVFAWGTWALMLVVAYAFVGKYGCEVFYEDDWVLVPVLTGDQPLTLHWLWKQNNEHRIPLPNLVILALYHLSDFDARAGMYFTVTALGVLAAFMIRTAASVRGRTSYADAFFPFALLNWGQYDNLIFGHQVYQSLPVLIAGSLVCLIMRWGTKMTIGRTLVVGICLVALPFCGSMGVVFAPPLAGWLLAFTLLPLVSRSPSLDPSCRWLAFAFALLALGLTAVYFYGFRTHYVVGGDEFPYHPDSPGVRATLVTAMKFLSTAFGYTGLLLWWTSGVLVCAILAVSGVALGRVFLARPPERIRMFGLLCFFVAMAGLALGIGHGRAGFGTDMGFSSRYVTLAALAVCAAYFVWGIIGNGVGRLVQMLLFTLAAASLVVNARTGADLAGRHTKFVRALETDIRAGTPPLVLAARHTTGDYPIYTCRTMPDAPSLQDEFVQLLRMLKRTGRGMYRNLNDPAVTEVPYLNRKPFGTHQVNWSSDGTAECTGNDPRIVFAMDRPENVIGIRIKYAMADAAPPAQMEAFWRTGDEQSFSESERYYQTLLPVDPEERKVVTRTYDSHSRDWKKPRPDGNLTHFWVTIPVNATIDRFRIDPNNKPCTFKIEEIRLVIPAHPNTEEAR